MSSPPLSLSLSGTFLVSSVYGVEDIPLQWSKLNTENQGYNIAENGRALGFTPFASSVCQRSVRRFILCADSFGRALIPLISPNNSSNQMDIHP